MMPKIARTSGASFFLRGAVNSQLGSALMGTTPTYDKKPVRVLQVVFYAGEYAIFEVEPNEANRPITEYGF